MHVMIETRADHLLAYSYTIVIVSVLCVYNIVHLWDLPGHLLLLLLLELNSVNI